jgi:preprotein translocase subunit SecA
MLNKIVRIFGGDPNKRQIEKYTDLVDLINSLEPQFELLSDEALRAKTPEFRLRLVNGETLDEILPEAFAAVREASKRTLGQRHYDVQLIGGATLHSGKIAEMRTGEGKTLVATLPLYLNALVLNTGWIELAQRKWGADPSSWTFEAIDEVPVGQGVHLITVNDYLARRDARWMGVIYQALGLQVGVLQMAARTENGKKAFVVDFERESPHEDQDHLRLEPRAVAYATDITYGTNSEFGFDYLRDNMVMRLEDRVQRGHFYAIVDEVDNVLIDEARTPLIISGPAQDDTEWYLRMSQVVKGLSPEDYEISERDRTVTLTEIGETHVESLLNMPLRDPERPEDITPEQARLMGYLEQALRAQFLFRRNKDYLIQSGKVIIIDEFTGRLMPGRRWSDGLHQSVEAKEGVRVERENVTYATITIQNYFRMYKKLAGMTGTALTEAEEFSKIYTLDVLPIPTNLEYQAARAETDLIELEDKDAKGYKFNYFADKNDPDKTPLFWRRQDFPDVVYRTEEAKLRSIATEAMRYHAMGRPVLLGTTSVELSERISNRFRAEPVRRLALVALLRQAWMKRNNREEDGRAIPELEYLNQPIEKLPIADMRKMARDLELTLNPEAPENVKILLDILELDESVAPRLQAILQAGIPHQVLNARKHTEESQIITGAGAFGAVTIATNMAGRGVDIKLGGELAEEIIAAVSRVLRRAGYADPYDMTLDEQYQALLAMNPDDYGIYEGEVKFFTQHIEDMRRVRELGGLHVIGSERHESRRIDNQLRGRSARQGDPGSSRFYLSMEDELMRLFGGQQAEGLMQRMKIDEALPLEVGLVGRLVEQSQTRVEGANFDVRKHLLEYDDVLNTQRASIYNQRNRIFVKEDLSEDVTEMLQAEVNRRVPGSLDDTDGPWKLLAWLDQIQPPLVIDRFIYPSFTLRLILEHILGARTDPLQALALPTDTTTPAERPLPPRIDAQAAQRALLEVVDESLKAEGEHIMHGIAGLLDATRQRFQDQLDERLEMVDTFFEALEDADETDDRSPRQIADELTGLVRMPLKLSPDEQRLLRQNPRQVKGTVRDQVTATLYDQTLTRLLGAVERRLEEDLDLNRGKLNLQDWDELSDQILDALEAGFERRRQRLVGQNGEGQIARELENTLGRAEGQLNENQLLTLLMQLPQGSRAAFDRRTHRRIVQRTTRLTYFYAAAHLLERKDPQTITEEVLTHLEGAQTTMRFAWGVGEWNRLAAARPSDLDETTQSGLRNLLGEEYFTEIQDQPLLNLPMDERLRVVDELGRQSLTEIYRQLLLGVISELWVEYLTNMEALRVSIGLEAYAQRDPLVEYKNRAFSMFQELLENMRSGVVTRMFTYRPRDLSTVQTAVSAPALQTAGTPAEAPAGVSAGSLAEAAQASAEAARGPQTASEPAAARSGQPHPSQPAKGKRHRKRR